VKRISTDAYQALREALPAVTWYKRNYESLLRTALRDHPELLAGLNFSDTKRAVADQLVGQLVRQESRYQEATLGLMLEIASMTTFPDIARLTEPDRTERVAAAMEAVARLQAVTTAFSDDIEERERIEAAQRACEAQAQALRQFEDELAAIKLRFLELHAATDHQARGRAFEVLLTDLLLLYDLEPRLAYNTELDQIDGSLTFDTDDYIVEARWRAEQTGREHGDVFKVKVGNKGKNALGLFVSIQGFTSTFIEAYNRGTPFMTMDGADVFLILDNRVRLDDALRAKKRHANDTGSCHLPLSQWMQT